MADERPSRESMREVKREYKARQKADKQRAKAAADYWAAESGRPAPRRKGVDGAALLGVGVCLVAVVVGGLFVLKGGPFAATASSSTTAPTTRAPGSTSASPGSPGADPLDGVPPRMRLMTTMAPPGSCLSELEINPDGGRRLATGSCDEVHAAEVVSLTDGSEIWAKYPTAAQRQDFDDRCVAQGLLFLGWSGGTDAEAQAFIERAMKRKIAIQSAFPSRKRWKADSAIICAIGKSDGETPAGSLRGSMLS